MGNCCSTEATAVVERPDKAAEPRDKPAAASTNGSSAAPADADPEPAPAPEPEPASPAGESASVSAPSTDSTPDRIQTPTRGPTAGFGSPADVPGATHTVALGGYSLRYSYYSKRGYYPEGTRLDFLLSWSSYGVIHSD